jgi:translation initiation factor IF-3
LRRRPRRPSQTVRTATAEPRVNRRIRVPRVLLIDEKGARLGEFMTEDALRLAEERGLDLVEVAPNSRPPVCRIVDYGRLKYEKKKKDAVARRKQVQVQLKEVKLRPKTDTHDMEFKVKHARRFLTEGDKVKVTVRFRGREMAHRDIGEAQCYEMAELCKDLGVIEMRPRMEGRQMFMIIASLRKKVPKMISKNEDGEEIEEDEEEEGDDYEDYDGEE